MQSFWFTTLSDEIARIYSQRIRHHRHCRCASPNGRRTGHIDIFEFSRDGFFKAEVQWIKTQWENGANKWRVLNMYQIGIRTFPSIDAPVLFIIFVLVLL